MSKQDDHNFDLQIRSLLEGAEEKVPAGVWEGVSSTLAARRRVVLMRRIGLVAGFAAAAALVVGVFLFRDGLEAEVAVAEEGIVAKPVATLGHVRGGTATESTVGAEANAEAVWQRWPSAADATSSSAPASGGGDVAGPAQDDRRCEKEEVTCAGNPASVASGVAGQGEEIAPATEVPGTGDANDIPGEAEGGAKESVRDEAAPAFDLTHPDADLTEIKPLGKAPRRLLALSAGGLMETNGNPVRSAFTGYRASGTVLPKSGVREHGDNGIYGVPFSLGLGLQWHFAPRWALATGLSYSCLSRSFTGTYTVTEGDAITLQITSNIDNSIHYLGIPLQLNYSLTGPGPVECYAFAGTAVEKGLVNRFRIRDAESDIIYKEHVDGLQLSFTLGLGARFPLTDRIGLYLDPSLHYYPDCGQPRSIRTRQQLMFSLEAGLRFDL